MSDFLLLENDSEETAQAINDALEEALGEVKEMQSAINRSGGMKNLSAALKKAVMASRINTLLSLPMLLSMVMAQNLY